MSDFIRPEARAALWKWREALVGLGVALLGLYWATQSFGFLALVGWALVALACVLMVAGLQRARFRFSGPGPGIVKIDEGRIGYMGPLDGGLMDMGDMTRLSLDPTSRPAHWHLEGVGGQSLFVPVNATGAEDLFDLFAQLPGIRTSAMVSALEQNPDNPVVIWQMAPRDQKFLH